MQYHPWVNTAYLIGKYQVGILKRWTSEVQKRVIITLFIKLSSLINKSSDIIVIKIQILI